MSCKTPIYCNANYVPCGVCYDCVRARRNSWTMRNLVEFNCSACAYFVTLTYDEQHIQTLDYCTEIDSYLPSVRHYQLFLKRLRKYFSNAGISIRYFMCSEFGSKELRPHYHIILYFSNDYNLKKSEIVKLWSFGFVEVDRLNQARIHYTTKYLDKTFRFSNQKLIDYFWEMRDYEKYDEAVKSAIIKKYSFLRMSTRPAIGYQFIQDEANVKYIRDKTFRDYRYPSVVFQGMVFQLPRYYIKKIFSDEERRVINIHNIQNEMERRDKECQDYKVSDFQELYKIHREHSKRRFQALREAQKSKEV